MFGFTAKITKRKLLCAAMIILIPALIFIAVKFAGANQQNYSTKAKSTAERVAFLANFGWQCDEKNETVKDTKIPETFDDVYTSYNELQLAQGFDLTKYKGKSVKIYTLKILNYPENSEYVYSSLMVYDNNIIGGDVHSTALSGFMHGFDLSGTGLSFGQRKTTTAAK